MPEGVPERRAPAAPPRVALDEFFESAGRAITDARTALRSAGETSVAGGGGASVELANVELTLRVLVDVDREGRWHVRTPTAEDLRGEGVDPRALSTVRAEFVAVPGEAPPGAAGRARRSVRDVIEEFLRRDDISALRSRVGELDIKADFIPRRGRWLLTALDGAGRVVGEALLPDDPARARPPAPT